MNKNFKHDFKSAVVKHSIEEEFYKLAGKELGISQISGAIVTGPDFQRHIDNYKKYISKEMVSIYEIDMDIFIDIYKGCKSDPKVKVVSNTVEKSGARFIDCDLTCTSNLVAIKNTLLKQIENQAQTATINKVFIFSFGLRTSVPKSKEIYLRPIFGLLGASVASVSQLALEDIGTKGCGLYKRKLNIAGTKGRIKNYICYEYNAGGGSMITCILIYK